MEVDQVKNSNNNHNNNNNSNNKKKKNGPSVPSNFVTIVQLEERWLQEKQIKLKKEKDQEEAAAQEENERQRKLQLQKLREKEEEKRKRKLVQSQGRLKFNANDRKPDRRPQIWRENRRGVVEVSPAKKPEALVAVEVGIGNVSAQKEQTGEEAKENNNEKQNKKKKRPNNKKKMKPRSEEEKEKEKEEVEVTGGASHAPKVIGEKENSPARTNGESEGTKSEFRPTAEIERKFGDFTIGKGNVRVTRPNTGIYRGHGDNRAFGGSYGDYKGSSKFGDRKEVQKPSGAGMVWVKKGEIGGVHNQRSITEPKKSN